MIDNNKIGKYIRELRNKSKLTQEELSEKIFVSRQAVSNWETGKDAPSIDNVKNMCSLFNVSMVDLYAGEKVKDIKTLNNVIHSLITLEIKRSKKILILSSIIIFILIVLFLVYYFITYYNNITAYIVKGNTPNYDINGIMNKTVDNLYFNLEVDKSFDKICLVYNDDTLICDGNNNYITFTESNGYEEIIPLDKKRFKDYISNMYVTLEKDGNTDRIKLDINEVYKNDNLFKENNPKINKNDDYKLEFADVPEKIKENFKYNESYKYFYLNVSKGDKKVEMFYFSNMNNLYVTEYSKTSVSKWVYNFNNKYIGSYAVENNSQEMVEYNNITRNETDKNKKEIYEYFKENYVDEYLE